MDFTWRFRCAGLFGGVSSFTEDDEERSFIRVDFFGGKVSIAVTREVADRVESTCKPGCMCRVEGTLTLGGSGYRLAANNFSFEGSADFQAVSEEEKLQGCIWEGTAQIRGRRCYESRSSGMVYLVKYATFGAVVETDVSKAVFDTVGAGFVEMFGFVNSEYSTEFRAGKKVGVFRNDLQITGIRELKKGRR